MKEGRLEAARPPRRLALEVFMSQKSTRSVHTFSGALCWLRFPGQCLGLAEPLPSGQTLGFCLLAAVQLPPTLMCLLGFLARDQWAMASKHLPPH